jgi:L-aminopeptidase/D-esterase-like protein
VDELTFDFPGLRIGIAEYEEGPTGCTVFHFAGGAMLERDVRGGSPGTFGDLDWVDAICLAGGSLYGLEACTGVAAELFEQRGHDTGWGAIADVTGAIIFDFGGRDNAIYPDKELGRAAFRAAREGLFPLGRRGAGRSATVGKTFGFEQAEPGGQGGAFRHVGDTRIAVFTVVNAVGAIVDRDGTVVRGHFDTPTGARRVLVEGIEARVTGGNTTLTVVATNQKLDRWLLRQLARQVHTSMARAIHPFHALTDGDVLFAATTNEVENAELDSLTLGVLASELAWDAVLAAVG